jgi:hypothetical protein
MGLWKSQHYQFVVSHKWSICGACLFAFLAVMSWKHSQWSVSVERQSAGVIFETYYLSSMVIGALILLFLILWQVPKQQSADPSLSPKERIELENSARVTIAQILGGTVLLTGLYFTWQNLRVSEEGQITERFTRAIGQLGDDKLQIRLGGIYALERIARDSPRDLRTPIIVILAAYVRERDPWPEVGKTPEVGNVPFHKWPEGNVMYSCVRPAGSAVQNLYERAPDIQAIMTIIGRRSKQEEDQRFDLSSTDLRGADLNFANLSYLDLSRSNLEGACLESASLEFTDLTGANLRFAMLGNLDLSKVTGVSPAQLKEAVDPPKVFP